MNIVKLKDVVMPDCVISNFFNTQLKGKYAYWIQMRYIFPLDSLDYKTYIKYEQYDAIHFMRTDMLPHLDLYSEACCAVEFAQRYIDIDATEEANSTYEFSMANNYVADPDIDVNNLRIFRTWLASELLKLNTGLDGNYLNKYSTEQLHMLEYYRNTMYNDVVKYLNIFGSTTPTTVEVKTGCGCGNVSGLYNTSIVDGCDALVIYRSNIHKMMVKTFENVDFWTSFSREFIAVLKQYIDNILRLGLIANSYEFTNPLAECGCTSDNNNMTKSVLKRLSTALQYIVDDNVTGHVNFIHDALYDWAEYLYDNMYWPTTK